MKEEMIIYTQENCKYCEQLKSLLQDKEIEFTEISTKDRPKEWQKIMYMSTMGVTPTILYKDFYFIANRDFQSPQQLIQVLTNFEKPDVDNNTLVLERVKTLNYNIMLALQNINGVITRIHDRLQQIENKLNTEENEHKSTD